MKKTTLLAAGAAALSTAANAATLSIAADNVENFGRTGGVEVLLSSTTSPNWDTPPINGVPYSIDSFSVVKNNSDATITTLSVGVYTSFTPAADLDSSSTYGGFLGSSDATVAWGAGGLGDSFTWTFSGITATAGADESIFFAFQDASGTPIPAEDLPEGALAIQRLASGNQADERAAITQVNSGIRLDRIPVLNVGITAVPEPGVAALCGLAVVGFFRRRR